MTLAMDIGIVGYGTVGKAVALAFQDSAQVRVYDPAYTSGDLYEPSLESVWQKSRFTFVCVPTPQLLEPGRIGGPFDGAILDQCIQNLIGQGVASGEKILVMVSTVLPSKISQYRKQWPDSRLVVCPEFLTERGASDDFLNPRFRILGGSKKDTTAVHDLFSKFSKCQPCPVGYCDAVGAALIKYMSNAYLALKVSMLNQFFDFWKRSDCETDWNELTEVWQLDSRIGNSHFQVPGPDGDRGWGGKCFPKDVNALLYEARDKGVSLSILEEAWNYNKAIRTRVDWVD